MLLKINNYHKIYIFELTINIKCRKQNNKEKCIIDEVKINITC